MAIRAGRIAALGTREDVARWRGPATRVVDLGAATVTPGLIDAHIHPVLGAQLTRGVALLGLDLDGVRRALGRSTRATVEPGAWVLGWGLDPNVVHGRTLTAADIDDVVGGRPALIRLFDGHSALASSRALEDRGRRRSRGPSTSGRRSCATPTAGRPGCCWRRPRSRSWTTRSPRPRSRRSRNAPTRR